MLGCGDDALHFAWRGGGKLENALPAGFHAFDLADAFCVVEQVARKW